MYFCFISSMNILPRLDTQSYNITHSTSGSELSSPRNVSSGPKWIYIQPLSLWWCHQMEIFSALLVLCAGNSPVTGEFLSQRSVSVDVFFDLCLNKRLQFSKQSWDWWFETPSRPLWRHCNDNPRYNNAPELSVIRTAPKRNQFIIENGPADDKETGGFSTYRPLPKYAALLVVMRYRSYIKCLYYVVFIICSPGVGATNVILG